MSDDGPKKKAAAGLPAWVMTFADLMTLLMCFFVLLLSFSEMDVAKYKQLAGSMKEAFGVQRKVEVKEPPKGVNVIATEFSAGRPNPTPFNVVEQLTSDDARQFLDTGGKQRKAGDDGEPTAGKKSLADDGNLNDSATQDNVGGKDQHRGLGADEESAEARAKAQALAIAQAVAEAKAAAKAEAKAEAEAEKAQQARDSINEQMVMLPKEDALRALKAKESQEAEERLEQTAKRIRAALRWEIKDGAVDVEKEDQKIIIRIREQASFSSGGAALRENFRPILDRVGQVLKETEGRIIVSGHTDERPIATTNYRSNWDLSASRAVSVVHELIDVSQIPSGRFSIEGLAETQPVAPNDTTENRAKNRRVEIKLLQGDDLEASGTLGIKAGAGASAPVLRSDKEPSRPVPIKVESKPKLTQQPNQGIPKPNDPFVRKE